MMLTFDQRADSYSQAAVVQRELATWLAQWLEPSGQTGCLAALELGAGDGMFTRHLAGRFSRLAAVDQAPRMVARGRRLLPDVTWCVGNAWQLGGLRVDRLYSSSLLHFSGDPAAVLRHWRTVVSRGGRMLHGFYAAPTLAEWHSLGLAPPLVQWRSPSQWQEYFRESGWTVLRWQSQQRQQRFPSARALARFFQQTGVVAPRRTSVGRLRRLLGEYERRFSHPDGSSGVATTWTFCRVEALNA